MRLQSLKQKLRLFDRIYCLVRRPLPKSLSWRAAQAQFVTSCHGVKPLQETNFDSFARWVPCLLRFVSCDDRLFVTRCPPHQSLSLIFNSKFYPEKEVYLQQKINSSPVKIVVPHWLPQILSHMPLVEERKRYLGP